MKLRSLSVLVCTLLFFGFGTSVRLHAQCQIESGQELPSSPRENQWFLSSQTQELHFYRDGKWNVVNGEVRSAVNCHGHLLITTMSGEFGELLPEGFESRHAYFCGDSICVVWDYIGFHSVYDASGLKSKLVEPGYCKVNPTVVVVQGMEGICIPSGPAPSYLKRNDCLDQHNWGVLGGNGKWLIQPIFSGPFHFKKGIAEVVYYGQKRKINESGAWMD
jgi:hypothetical protein